MVKLDLAGLIAFIAALAVLPWLGPRVWGAFSRGYRALAARGGASLAAAALVCLAANGAVALYHGIPIPLITDESSYLLGADTFLAGRLTNPPHPFWEHFESQHIILQPTYQSKFPPAQAVFLAFGKLLTGQAIAGAWIGLALACAGLVYMLRSWVGPGWALFGGLLAAVSPSLIKGWGQTYWGGGVAMLGGALVFGAVRRVFRQPRSADGLLLGLGLALLANSRPFEGFLAGLVAAAVLAFWLFFPPRPELPLVLRRVVLPTSTVLLAAALGMAYYNYRVTGDPLLMPYQTWHKTYRTGSLVFDKPEPAGEADKAARAAPPAGKKAPAAAPPGQGKKAPKAREGRGGPARRLPGTQEVVKSKGRWKMIQFDAVFFAPGMLALGLLGLPLAWRDRWAWIALAGSAVVIGAVFLQGTTIFAPHYLAPVAALCFALIVTSLRRLRTLRWRRFRPGRWLVRAIACAFAVAAVSGMIRWVSVPPNFRWAQAREKMIAQLNASPDKHLVIVHYARKTKIKREWVYNGTDIDAAKVVWARDLGQQRNRKLIEYFAGRKVWWLNGTTMKTGLKPYSAAARGGRDPGAPAGP